MDNWLQKLSQGGKLAIKLAPYVISIASIIAAATPTPADDTAIAIIKQVVNVLALNVGHASGTKDEN